GECSLVTRDAGHVDQGGGERDGVGGEVEGGGHPPTLPPARLPLRGRPRAPRRHSAGRPLAAPPLRAPSARLAATPRGFLGSARVAGAAAPRTAREVPVPSCPHRAAAVHRRATTGSSRC